MHWETRIRELGGKSYSSKGARMLDRYNVLFCQKHSDLDPGTF